MTKLIKRLRSYLLITGILPGRPRGSPTILRRGIVYCRGFPPDFTRLYPMCDSPRRVPLAPTLGEHDHTPPPGDHKGPPNRSSSTLAPTGERGTSPRRVPLAPTLGEHDHTPPPGDHKGPPNRSSSALAPTGERGTR